MPGLLGRARDQLGASMDWLHERGFRVIGLTLRGYGDSLPKPRDFPDNFYHRDCCDLLAFMDALQIKRAHLPRLFGWRRSCAYRVLANIRSASPPAWLSARSATSAQSCVPSSSASTPAAG